MLHVHALVLSVQACPQAAVCIKAFHLIKKLCADAECATRYRQLLIEAGALAALQTCVGAGHDVELMGAAALYLLAVPAPGSRCMQVCANTMLHPQAQPLIDAWVAVLRADATSASSSPAPSAHVAESAGRFLTLMHQARPPPAPTQQAASLPPWMMTAVSAVATMLSSSRADMQAAGVGAVRGLTTLQASKRHNKEQVMQVVAALLGTVSTSVTQHTVSLTTMPAWRLLGPLLGSRCTLAPTLDSVTLLQKQIAAVDTHQHRSCVVLCSYLLQLAVDKSGGRGGWEKDFKVDLKRECTSAPFTACIQQLAQASHLLAAGVGAWVVWRVAGVQQSSCAGHMGILAAATHMLALPGSAGISTQQLAVCKHLNQLVRNQPAPPIHTEADEELGAQEGEGCRDEVEVSNIQSAVHGNTDELTPLLHKATRALTWRLCHYDGREGGNSWGEAPGVVECIEALTGVRSSSSPHVAPLALEALLTTGTLAELLKVGGRAVMGQCCDCYVTVRMERPFVFLSKNGDGAL